MKIKKGTIRDDGMVFYQYRKYKDSFYESWVTPEQYEIYMQASRDWSLKNRESNLERRRAKDKNNRLHAAAIKRKCRKKRDKEGAISRIKERLATNCRSRIHQVLKKKNHSYCYIGLNSLELFNYLESKFKPGMTWDNYGVRGWHVDHIIPLASANSLEEIIPLLHYTNLQPLWATENIRKGAKMPADL